LWEFQNVEKSDKKWRSKNFDFVVNLNIGRTSFEPKKNVQSVSNFHKMSGIFTPLWLQAMCWSFEQISLLHQLIDCPITTANEQNTIKIVLKIISKFGTLDLKNFDTENSTVGAFIYMRNPRVDI
jgi:hypothetical protein